MYLIIVVIGIGKYVGVASMNALSEFKLFDVHSSKSAVATGADAGRGPGGALVVISVATF